ncbi:MAG: right-handed parallel beta-helix repeat-containing protein [Alphaproteobacteria bacterium]|nr:right-handed parallel beta-helix repeat-containing protein [Alphaproteobacteria bacterium]
MHRHQKAYTCSKLMATSALIAIAISTPFSSTTAADYTLPVNPTVVGGTSVISNPAIGELHVNQASDRTVINWDSFNIGTDARVQFFQPNTSSLAVNRVVNAGISPTQILGELQANGRVMVLDRNGVLFGPSSHIDVGGIVASSADVLNAQVMAGAPVLDLFNFGTGSVENYGMITAADSGLVAFVAPTVKNAGVIQANLGKVILAAGNETATVDLYGDGLVSLAYTDKNDNLLSENTGMITAESGKVLMSTAQAKDIVDAVVNLDGVVNATSASLVNGQIVLSAKKVNIAQTANVAAQSTQVNAKNVDLGATIGGAVSGSAETVTVLSDNAKINQAISIVSNNGTVFVAPGTYHEVVTVNKEGVSLLGAKAGVSVSHPERTVGESIIAPNSPGIVVTSDNVLVDGFLVTGADNAIEVLSADNVIIQNNILNNSAQSGVYVIDSDATDILGNLVDTSDYDGIHIIDSTNTSVVSNTVIDSGLLGIPNERGNGILIQGTTNAYVVGNDVTGSLWDGIKAVFSDDLTVNNNTVYDVTRAGVSVENSADAQIVSNTLTNLGMVGVWSEKNANVIIDDNLIDDAGSFFGIFHNLGNNATITGNTVTAADIYGLYVRHSSDLNISGNMLDNSGIDGMNLDQVAGNVVVSNNNISNSAVNGIRLVSKAAPLNVMMSGNAITNSSLFGFAGISLDGGATSKVTIADNTIANNMEYGLLGQSGEIDLTGLANTIEKTDIGMGFYPNGPTDVLTLTGDTIGQTHFIDQNTLFVDLGADAFFPLGLPTQLDGMNASYTIGATTIAPSVLGFVTPAELVTLEAMINHFNDTPDRGQFFFIVGAPPIVPLAAFTFEQSDVFKSFVAPQYNSNGKGSLVITGLPSVGRFVNVPRPTTPTNFNNIAPAAGGEEGNTGENLSNIEPAAGTGAGGTSTDAACWADANVALGKGSAVVYSLGGDAEQRLSDVNKCGTSPNA